MWRLVIPSCAISLVVSPMSNLVKSAFVINSHGLYCHFWWLNPAPENPKIWRLNHSCWELNHLKSWVLLVQSAISWHFMTTCYCSLVWSPFCFGLKIRPLWTSQTSRIHRSILLGPPTLPELTRSKRSKSESMERFSCGRPYKLPTTNTYIVGTHTHTYIYTYIHYITLLNIYMSYTVST